AGPDLPAVVRGRGPPAAAVDQPRADASDARYLTRWRPVAAMAFDLERGRARPPAPHLAPAVTMRMRRRLPWPGLVDRVRRPDHVVTTAPRAKSGLPHPGAGKWRRATSSRHCNPS